MAPSKKNKGFTLVETIIAITVIALAIASVSSLTASSLRLNAISQNQLIAFELAQEGLEAIRNIRDTNWLKNDSWRGGATVWGSDLRQDGLYLVNPVSLAAADSASWELEKIQAGEEERGRLYLHASGEVTRYQHQTSDQPSGFARIISLETRDHKMRVTSEVTYEDRGEQKSVSLVMDLTDWKQGPL